MPYTRCHNPCAVMIDALRIDETVPVVCLHAVLFPFVYDAGRAIKVKERVVAAERQDVGVHKGYLVVRETEIAIEAQPERVEPCEQERTVRSPVSQRVAYHHPVHIDDMVEQQLKRCSGVDGHVIGNEAHEVCLGLLLP